MDMYTFARPLPEPYGSSSPHAIGLVNQRDRFYRSYRFFQGREHGIIEGSAA